MAYLCAACLIAVGIIACMLYAERFDHAETRQERDVALEMERQERQRREVAEHVLNRINAAHLPPALVPLERQTYELHEVLGE